MNHDNDNLPDRLLRLKEVQQVTAMGRSSIYRNMSSGLFPKPVALGSGSVRWRVSDIRQWMQNLEAA
ncbi:MAG: AlpA family transcriptional regulator [Rhizobiaceae bacterium]|nr:AlpA family transcriptional regulator [Rhizobiaceae bacterium]MCV0406342.1 AlpA family transcriptional regulator [Rhizobiaceae bacterium]